MKWNWKISLHGKASRYFPVLCFSPHQDKRNACFSFCRMDEGVTKKFNLERSEHNRCQMLFLTFSVEEKCSSTPEIKTFPFGLLKGFVLSHVNIQLCFLTAARGLMGAVVQTEIFTFPPPSSNKLPAHANYKVMYLSMKHHVAWLVGN